jgi:hypothetical protein
MAINRGSSMANDSMHVLLEQEVVETGTDIFKPINSNPTSSRIQNPFAVERAKYVKQLREQEERSKAQR